MGKQSHLANDFAPDIESRLLPPKIARETPPKSSESSACPSFKLLPATTGFNGISISLHNDFRVILREVVGKDTMREESRPSKSIVVCEDFLRFGIADTAISMIAPGHYLVLTAELALAGRLKKRGVDVINFNNHRFAPWQ